MLLLDKHDPVGPAARLTPEEDGILRRLHYFETYGLALAEPLQELKSELRGRDLRASIREPIMELELLPA